METLYNGAIVIIGLLFSLTTLGSSDVALVISFIAAFIYAFISIVQSKAQLKSVRQNSTSERAFTNVRYLKGYGCIYVPTLMLA